MLNLCAAVVGVMSYYMADRKYRTAFLEARQSLGVKLTLEEQSTQQVSGSHRYTFRMWVSRTHLWGRTPSSRCVLLCSGLKG